MNIKVCLRVISNYFYFCGIFRIRKSTFIQGSGFFGITWSDNCLHLDKLSTEIVHFPAEGSQIQMSRYDKLSSIFLIPLIISWKNYGNTFYCTHGAYLLGFTFDCSFTRHEIPNDCDNFFCNEWSGANGIPNTTESRNFSSYWYYLWLWPIVAILLALWFLTSSWASLFICSLGDDRRDPHSKTIKNHSRFHQK